MDIQIDSREKVRAIRKIVKTFDESGVKYFSSKLLVGDYMSLDNPRLIIDRKQNLQELCGNVCQQHEKAKYQGQLNEYSRFCRKMGLAEERERIYYDMRGRVATNTKMQNARYTSDMIRNADRDSKQYYQYKKILGDDAGSLADFRQMKYNNPKDFDLLTDYKNSVGNGMLSPLSGFKNYKKLYGNIENDIVGMKTSNGIKISGQSKHFIERVIGTKEDPKTKRIRNGVEIEDIQYALLYGEIRTRKRDPDSVKFVTDKCIVSVNPNTGILIQCNPQ